MFCPKCRGEYRPGFLECADCGVPLVEDPPESSARASVPPLEAVLTTSRSEMIALAKSILISAEIEFTVKGECVQDMFGYGRFPFGRNLVIGPMEVLVRPEDSAEAREMLATLASEEAASSCATGDGNPLSSRDWFRRAPALAKLIAWALIGYFVVSLVAGVVMWVYPGLGL